MVYDFQNNLLGAMLFFEFDDVVGWFRGVFMSSITWLNAVCKQGVPGFLGLLRGLDTVRRDFSRA